MSPTEGFAIDATEFDAAAGELQESDLVIGDALGDELRQLGPRVQANIRAAARPHRRTGRMEADVSARSSGAGIRSIVEVTAGPPANLIVGGTRPHDIRPLGHRALSLVGGRYAAHVMHPGTAPDPFVAEGVRASEGDIDRALDAAGAVIVGRLADELGG